MPSGPILSPHGTKLPLQSLYTPPILFQTARHLLNLQTAAFDMDATPEPTRCDPLLANRIIQNEKSPARGGVFIQVYAVAN